MTPRIVLDGKHDDFPGIQALLDRRYATIETDSVRYDGETIRIEGGQLNLSQTLTIGRNSPSGCFQPASIDGPESFAAFTEGRRRIAGGLALRF